MKIRLQAVEWALGRGVTFDELFQRLQQASTDEDGKPLELDFKGRKRILVAQAQGDFWILLFLTVRDHRRFCEMQRQDDGGISITIREVTEGAEVVDFNFLICHKETGRGVYSYYHRSCHFDDLTRHCRDVYREWRSDLIGAAIVEGGNTDQAKRDAEKRYAGLLSGTLLLTPQQIRELVETLHTIKLLEMSFGEVQVGKNWGQPLHGLVRVAKHTFTFSQNIPIRRLRDRVIQAIERAQIHRGKVVGDTADGIEHAYHLKRNAGTFEELDFDEVAEELAFDFGDLADSVIVKKMETAIKQRPGYFVLPEKGAKKSKAKPAAKSSNAKEE
jgi:hypothetical protein